MDRNVIKGDNDALLMLQKNNQRRIIKQNIM